MQQLAKRLPSRTQLIVGSVFTGTGSWFYYDRSKTKEILEHYKERASAEIASVPIKDVLEQPRKLQVYFGATFPQSESDDKEYSESEAAVAHRDMNEMRWCFDQYAKPVLDAAAVDYTVTDKVQSLTDLRTLVQEQLNQVDGSVAFGRVAFKALVLEAINPKTVQIAVPDNRWFFVRWFWSPQQISKEVVVPNEIGYIAHVAPSNADAGGDRWFNRWPKKLHSFCNRRHLAHRISEAAFVVAQGETVPMDHAVPGTIKLQVDHQIAEISEEQTHQVQFYQEDDHATV